VGLSGRTDEQPYPPREVVVLVARGLTNRQISREIGISEHTAGNHVAKLLRKLGLRSRAQIAAWASPLDYTATT
jgi:DNA-binding NarL/FixJ family response regulator